MSTGMLRARTLVWVLPAVLLLALFVYFPMFDSLRLSLYEWDAFNPKPDFVGLANYQEMFADPIFWKAIFNNLAYAVVSLLFQVGLALVLAAVLEELVGKRLRGPLRTLYFIPAAVAITVVGILFTFIYNPEFGLLNAVLELVGLDSWTHAWLGEESTAIWSIIAMSQWQGIGYSAILFVVAIQRIPRMYHDAVHIDGGGHVRAFFTITVPMVREMTTLLVILTVSGAFLVFNEVMVMTAGGPNNSSQVLGTWLYRKAFFEDNMGYASAVASVIFVITFGFAAIELLIARRRRFE